MSAIDDLIRSFLSPATCDHHDVTAPAAGGAWATLTAPPRPSMEIHRYHIVVSGHAADVEVSFEPSPAAGAKGIVIPAGTVWTSPDMAPPFRGTEDAAWPSFRAIGASPVATRVALFLRTP